MEEEEITGKSHILNIGCGGRAKDKLCWYGDERIDVKSYPNVTKVMDAHQLEFAKETFSKIVSYECLEHLQSPFTALQEMCRVLKPDGEIEISVPNVWHWRLLLRGWLGQHFKRYRGLAKESESGHKQMWDIYTFEELCNQVGLTVQSLEFLDWYDNRERRKLSLFEPLIKLVLPKHVKYTHVIFRLKKINDMSEEKG
jgi:predicted SAM-dependent methyltransferase